MSLLARRSSRIRQQRLRRLAALSVAVLVVGGGLGATLALAGGPSTIRIAAVTVPCPVLWRLSRTETLSSLLVVLSSSRGPSSVAVSRLHRRSSHSTAWSFLSNYEPEHPRGSVDGERVGVPPRERPSTVLVDNHVSLNGTTLDVPASAGGWGLIVGQKLVFSGDLEPNGQVNMDACATVSGSPSEVASIIKYTYPFQPGTDPLDVFSSSGVPTSSTRAAESRRRRDSGHRGTGGRKRVPSHSCYSTACRP